MGLPAVVAVLSMSLLAAAPTKKKAAPAPPPAASEPPAACTTLEQCLSLVEERFSATDFETASLVARRAEEFAKTDSERARVVLLQATLLFHSAGALTPETEGIIVSRFQLARRLDPALTALAIPAYARSQKLEALWDRAAPPAPPKAAIIPEPPPAPPPMVVETEPPRKRPVVPVVLGAVGVATAGAGGVLTWLSFDTNRAAQGLMFDVDRAARQAQAETYGTAAVILFSAAGAVLLTAIVTWLVL